MFVFEKGGWIRMNSTQWVIKPQLKNQMDLPCREVRSEYSSNKKNQGFIIKERATLYGVASLFNTEALFLLTGIKPEKLKDVESLVELKELMHSLDLTSTQITKLEAFFELIIRFNQEKHDIKDEINSPEQVFNLFRDEMRLLKKEIFKLIMLNNKNRIIKAETIFVGSLNISIAHPREVFKEAIINSASRIIICHNHPSGDPYPSDEDRQMTQQFVEGGKFLSIPVMDHVIIGHNRYFSFREDNLL